MGCSTISNPGCRKGPAVHRGHGQREGGCHRSSGRDGPLLGRSAGRAAGAGVGSIANLIVAERAAREGVRFGFADHARAGVPMTLASLAVAALWLWGLGRIGW